MKKYLENLLTLIRKDTTDEGESIKLVVVLRVLELVLLVYSATCAIFSFVTGLYSVAISFFFTFVVYFAFLHMSYRIRTRYQIICINFFAILSICIGVSMVGTETHMQNLLLALLVIDYFAEYGRYGQKTIMAVILCGVYIFLHFSSPDSQIPVTADHVLGLQVINIIYTFLIIGVVSYIYSRDSQHLEGKLLEYNNKLKKQASTDMLTGLCNRRTAIEFIEGLIKNPSNNGFCVCMCDIDFFKKVNDSYGHDIGDKVLRGVAEAMVVGFPQSCLISRWGGEEFLVIFPNMNGDDAKILLDIMRSRIKALEFAAGEKKFKITVTYGLAEYGFDSDADKVVKQADEKLYLGKQNGRDQVVF